MARSPRDLDDLFKVPPQERLRLANSSIDKTNAERDGSCPDVGTTSLSRASA